MQSLKAQIEFLVKGKEHTYLCDPGTPLPECFEALSMMRSYILGRIKEDQDNQSQASSNQDAEMIKEGE